MQIAIVTIFPQMFDSFVCEGMTRRALEGGRALCSESIYNSIYVCTVSRENVNLECATQWFSVYFSF